MGSGFYAFTKESLRLSDPNGTPQMVIDWKSDIEPSPEIIEHYHAQVSAYLDMTRTARGFGLIVLLIQGIIIPVTRMATS